MNPPEGGGMQSFKYFCVTNLYVNERGDKMSGDKAFEKFVNNEIKEGDKK